MGRSSICILLLVILSFLPLLSRSQPGFALHFDGGNDYVRVPHDASLDPDHYTLEVWVCPTIDLRRGGGIVPVFISKQRSNRPPERGYNLYYECRGNVGAIDHYFSQGEGWHRVRFEVDLDGDEWYHVAATHDGEEQIVYLNGEQVAIGRVRGDMVGTGNELNLGKATDPTPTWFRGRLDEIRIWSVARTAEEINDWMNRSLNGDEEGLVAYWDCNDGEGQILVDRSENGNNGTLGRDNRQEDGDPQWVESDAPIGSSGILELSDNALNFGIHETDEDNVNDVIIFSNIAEEGDFSDLSFEIVIQENMPDWITFDPEQGVIPAEEDVAVVFTVDFDRMDLGINETIVIVRTDGFPHEPIEIPVTIIAVEGFGTLRGTVTDASNDEPIPGSFVRLHGFEREAVTDGDGSYEFDPLPAWRYRVEVEAVDFRRFLSDEFELEVDQNMVLDVELLHATCFPSRRSILEAMPADRVEQVELTLRNTGNADLHYSIERRFARGGDAEPWDQRAMVNAAEQAEDNRLQGIQFAGDGFYVSGGDDGNGRGMIHCFTRDGEYTGSFDQFRDSPWGMRDLAWDDELLWGGDGNTIYGFTTEGELITQFEGPFDGDQEINRALTWDRARGLFWICDIGSDVVGVDREGNEVERIERNDELHVYGLASYPEDPEGFTVYLFSKDGDFDSQVNKLNPETGEIELVFDIETIDELKAGGACITGGWDPMSWVLLGVLQGRRDVMDHIGVWHIATRTVWMEVDREEGIIPGGDRETVVVSLSSAGFPNDIEMEAELIINHDGRGGEISIPVVLRVTEEGDVNERILTFQEDWNLVSLNITPEEPNLELMFAPLVETEQLLFMKNGWGAFYIPGLHFNNINFWREEQGYLVKVTEDCNLRVTGDPIEPDRPIQLSVGWSFVAYYPRGNMDPLTGFAGIADNLVIAKDGWGNFYHPRFGFNNIPVLEEGQGYQVKMNEEDDLIWQQPDERQASTGLRQRLSKNVKRTHHNMSLLLECEGLNQGNEVAVLSESGLLVGRGVVDSDHRCGIAVWGDDISTDAVDGMINGACFKLRVFDKDKETIVTFVLIEGDTTYCTDEFTYGILKSDRIPMPDKLILNEPYPNPFNDLTRLSFSLPEAGYAELIMTDLSGRVVRSILRNYFTAGSYSVTVNSAAMTSGVYILALAVDDKQLYRKVVLMK